MYLFISIDILWLKSSEEEIAVEGVQGSCLLSPYWLSAEIGYWAHFSQYQCTENCSQKHQHLHPLNMLRKVLIKINDKTPFTLFPLEYRGKARNQQFPWLKQWISAQFVPSVKAVADFCVSYFTACWPLYILKALVLFFLSFLFFLKYEPNNNLVLHCYNYIFTRINTDSRPKNTSVKIPHFEVVLAFPAQCPFDSLIWLFLLTIPFFLCFKLGFFCVTMAYLSLQWWKMLSFSLSPHSTNRRHQKQKNNTCVCFQGWVNFFVVAVYGGDVFWICAGKNVDDTEFFCNFWAALAQSQGLFWSSPHPTSNRAGVEQGIGRRHSWDRSPELAKGIFQTIWHHN